jgi:hypothetical protein
VPLRVAEGYGDLEVNDKLIKRINEQIGDNKIDVLPRGDDVGVMTLWVPPHLDKAQVTEAHHRAAGVFPAILRRFNAAGRRVSDSKNAGNYAPRQFAQEQEAREAAVSKALLQHVMNDMLSDGTIRIVEEGAGGRTKRWLEIV